MAESSPTLPRIRTLPDGTRIRIRAITPADRDALARGFAALSPQSKYERFLTPAPRLGERELDYFTRVDHHDHEALGAELAGTGEGVAIARFVRTGERTAEPAIVVADAWQGRGVAGHLLAALVDRAREEGVDRFVAHVLAENAASLHAFERLGETARDRAGPEVELSIALPPAGADHSGLLDGLRAAAAGAIRPGRAFWDRLTWRPAERTQAPRTAIVVALDATPHAERALAVGRQVALARGAALHLVAAVGGAVGVQERRREALEARAADLRADGLAVEVHVRPGPAPGVVLDMAAELAAALVVCAPHHGRSPVRLLLGGVSEQLAHRAPCDVLMVRPAPWASG